MNSPLSVDLKLWKVNNIIIMKASVKMPIQLTIEIAITCYSKCLTVFRFQAIWSRKRVKLNFHYKCFKRHFFSKSLTLSLSEPPETAFTNCWRSNALERLLSKTCNCIKCNSMTLIHPGSEILIMYCIYLKPHSFPFHSMGLPFPDISPFCFPHFSKR